MDYITQAERFIERGYDKHMVDNAMNSVQKEENSKGGLVTKHDGEINT